MARREFTKKTQREALARSGMRCEAVGAMYGLPVGHRCNADLGYGVQFDHIVLDANSKDNSLGNCAAVCTKCHGWKTAKHDIPMAAKTVRQRDRNLGVKANTTPIKSQGFAKRQKDGPRIDKSALLPLQKNKLFEAHHDYRQKPHACGTCDGCTHLPVRQHDHRSVHCLR